jgi:hypothetical protein
VAAKPAKAKPIPFLRVTIKQNAASLWEGAFLLCAEHD